MFKFGSALFFANVLMLLSGTPALSYQQMCNMGLDPTCKGMIQLAGDGEETPAPTTEDETPRKTDPAPQAQRPQQTQGAPDCRGRVEALASRCQNAESSASQRCSEAQETQVFEQGTASARNQLSSKNANYVQACQTAAQSYNDTAAQLTSLSGSCQSSVSSCSNACADMMREASSCDDTAARQRAQSLSGAYSSCSSGPLAQRPAQISSRANGLRSSAQETTQSCTQATQSSTNQNTAANGEKFQDSNVNASAGLPGGGGDSSSSTVSQAIDSRTSSSNTSAGQQAEAVNVSGKNLSASSSSGHGNFLLASLPETPAFQDSATDNLEDSKVRAASSSDASASFGGGGGGTSSRLRAYLPMSRKTAGSRDEVDDGTMKAAGTAEEKPDLSAFLPGRGRAVGGLLAGPQGCRIPDPTDVKSCAVPHGPTADIWLKMKERFELLRNAPPPRDFFFNEE